MMTDLMRWSPFSELYRFGSGPFATSPIFGGLFPTSPFEELDRLVDDFGGWFGWSRPGSVAFGSPMDVSVDANGYRASVALPGISPENIEVHVSGRTLHVRAVQKDGDSSEVRYEQYLTLPATVDVNQVAASYRHGLLEVTIPYTEAVKPRRIEIAAEQPKQLPKAA